MSSTLVTAELLLVLLPHKPTIIDISSWLIVFGSQNEPREET